MEDFHRVADDITLLSDLLKLGWIRNANRLEKLSSKHCEIRLLTLLKPDVDAGVDFGAP